MKNLKAGIPSPSLALFIVMLPKVHLTSHSRMSGSRERKITGIQCEVVVKKGWEIFSDLGSFRSYERDAFSSLRLTRNSDLKRTNGFCSKPQESPKPPTHTYSHRVPLHKPTDWEKKILIWSGRFKKEDEIPETVSFEMLDAAKNKVRVKISYVMIALTVAGCVLMIIEGKKAARRNETLTSLNLEKKARLREEAAMKAKTE